PTPTPLAPDIYTPSLHDALPIWPTRNSRRRSLAAAANTIFSPASSIPPSVSSRGGRRSPRASPHPSRSVRWRLENTSTKSNPHRSEEHTSELQSRGHLVCRLLLE